MRPPSALIVAVSAVALFSSLAKSLAQNTGAGSLDPTFNATMIPLDGGITFLRLSPDGGVLAGGLVKVPTSTPGGTSTSVPRLARFRGDGSLVPDYGANALAVGDQLVPREVDPAGRLLVVDSDGSPARLRCID